MGSQRRNIESSVKLALAGATVITVNTRAARSLRREAELVGLQEHVVFQTPDILPFEAWVSRTWTECLLSGVADRALLKPKVVAALWEQIVANSAAGRDLLSHRAAADLAAQAWQLLHAYKLPRSRALFQVTAESSAFYGWAENFDQRCRVEGWIDSAAAVQFLVAHCANLPKLPEQVGVFGFDQVTPLQTEMWTALRSAGVEVFEFSPDPENSTAHAVASSFSDTPEEIRTSALWARRQLERSAHARIGIIVPGLESWRDSFDTIFTECLHPETKLLDHDNTARSYDISLGRSLGDYPLIRAALLVLRLAVSGLTATDFSSLLNSRYLAAGTSEAAARARLDYKVRKLRKPAVTLAYALSGEVRKYQPVSPGFFRLLSDIERAVRKLPSHLTRSQWALEARRLLNAAGWPGDASGEMTLNSEEFQLTAAWDDLLTSFGALDQVLPPGAPADLLHELERAAGEATFAAENEAAPIQIVGPMAASGDSFDALWFCGLTDEAWPQRGQPNPFIPYALQIADGPYSSPEWNMRSAQRVTARLLQSAEECVLSWPAREDDRNLRPSPLLAGIKNIPREDLPIASVSDWQQLQSGTALEQLLDEKAPLLHAGELRSHGTSLLLWQSGCPFRAFAQARLAAEIPKEASLGADFIDRGNVTELALQYVWEQLRGSQEMREIPAERIEYEIAAAIDRAVNEAFPKGDEEWLRQHRDLERVRLKKLIEEWLEVEAKRDDFHNVQHQQNVEVKIGELTIHGRADRVDQTNDGAFVVIDYKTGGSGYSTNWWDTPRPQDPQLPIYAVAQRMQGHEIAGVAFAVVRSGKCSFKGEAVRKEVFGDKNHKRFGEFARTTEAWQPELERLAANFLAGAAEVDPHYPPTSGKNTCRLCHLGALCRIAEVKATEDDDEPQEIIDDE